MRLVFVLLIAVAAGCGDDSPQLSCSSDSACTMISMDLGGGPRCCGGYCVFPSVGCDSGVRYLTANGNFGSCVPTSQCAPSDMAMPPPKPKDLSMMSGGD